MKTIVRVLNTLVRLLRRMSVLAIAGLNGFDHHAAGGPAQSDLDVLVLPRQSAPLVGCGHGSASAHRRALGRDLRFAHGPKLQIDGPGDFEKVLNGVQFSAAQARPNALERFAIL